MRRILLLASLSVVLILISLDSSYAADSPIDRGSLFIGGEFSFSSLGGDYFENADGDRQTIIKAEPMISYFIIPGLAPGIAFELQRVSQGDYSNTGWALGMKLNYFFGGITQRSMVKGSIYPYLGILGAYLSQTIDTGVDEYSESGTIFDFGGGVMYMLTESVGFFGTAHYQLYNVKPEDGVSESGNNTYIGCGIATFVY